MAEAPGRCYPDGVAEPRVLTESEVRDGVAAYLSEGAGHHPDITINYNKVTLRLITHSEKALTDRDFGLAGAIDEKLASRLVIEDEAGE